ncbi:MAG TPA: BREX-2 system adenine-specific DNA-methyltransferase PglX, partial [Acidobacteriota bacterium]|nr:BREX-2 system adenine-specific DNA-methyltransferase PglX [Acidobacteriota bacterium]
MFGGKTKVECGLKWFEFGRLTSDKLRTPLSIAYGEIATHNHFVLDRGGKVFNRTAPVIKLPAGATEDEYLALLGLLNSSTACFWGRQTFFPKGGFAAGKWEERLVWNGTGLLQFPVTENKPLQITKVLDLLAQSLHQLLPSSLAGKAVPNKSDWATAHEEAHQILRKMIALQEELDWECYGHYGLIADPPLAGEAIPEIKLGERAFEIVLARQMVVGEVQTTWFDRHGSTPMTEIPAHWSAEYQRIVAERIRLIETDSNINLIERPEYKRRWNTEPWEAQAEGALREWMLNRLETPEYWPTVELQSVAKLADRARSDADFMQVAELYRGRPDFDVTRLVAELVESEAVPFLPGFR